MANDIAAPQDLLGRISQTGKDTKDLIMESTPVSAPVVSMPAAAPGGSPGSSPVHAPGVSPGKAQGGGIVADLLYSVAIASMLWTVVAVIFVTYASHG